jgi:ABC-type transport system involved in Fe-S cluster assembly fused permease/ATPase subunit
MIQYLWPPGKPKLKIALILSMVFLYAGKWFNLQVPFLLQKAVDTISKARQYDAVTTGTVSAAAAVTLYGLSRALSTICQEVKVCLFSHVSQNVLKEFAAHIFGHLHTLDSEYHLQTPSGVISVAYVRAIRGFQTILLQLVFSVAPAALELFMVSRVLFAKSGPLFAGITMCTFFAYLLFTIWITQFRVRLRQELVDVDNARNGYFIDSILNHEVVKLFNNEASEAGRFNDYLEKIRKINIDMTYLIAALNLGQAALFCAGLTGSLLIGLRRVNAGLMSVGDLVGLNSLLLQLSIPFNFMGYTYQELRQGFVDIGYMRETLVNVKSPTKNRRDCEDMDTVSARSGPSTIQFDNVRFSYSNSSQELLKGVSFKVEKGHNVAIVGPSGSGKSTTLRLIARLFDPSGGTVYIDGVDTKSVSTGSLRRRIAVVPQDTSLFDQTVRFNIMYGNSDATEEELEAVIEKCNLRPTINKLSNGLETMVGERGARLSGGERQKVSIARALLKDPSLILCDEVTSSVDAFAEREIVMTLRRATEERTTLTIAHRLSSITHCDQIIVMDRGIVVEQGTHAGLLEKKGVYSRMWNAQNGNNGNGNSVGDSVGDVSIQGVGGQGVGGYNRLPQKPRGSQREKAHIIGEDPEFRQGSAPYSKESENAIHRATAFVATSAVEQGRDFNSNIED